jgi:hypothetical protein
MAHSSHPVPSPELRSQLHSDILCYFTRMPVHRLMGHIGCVRRCRVICSLIVSLDRTLTSGASYGPLRSLFLVLNAALIDLFTRYADAVSSGLPGNPASPDPGPGVNNLLNVNGTSSLAPFTPDLAPDVTRAFPVTISFQNTDGNSFLGFMNSTVRTILSKMFFVQTLSFVSLLLI